MTTLQDFNKTCVLINNGIDTARPSGVGLPKAITLAGSGFEAIPNPNPVTYDNYNEYEGLLAGDDIPETHYRSIYAGYTLDSSDTFGDRQFSARSKTNKSFFDYPARRAGSSDFTNALYASWYIKFDEDMHNPPQPALTSSKVIRIWNTVDDPDNGPRVSWTNQHTTTGNRVLWDSPDPVAGSGNGQWKRLEVYYNNERGLGNCFIEYWMDGKFKWRINDFTFTSTHTGATTTNQVVDPAKSWESAVNAAGEPAYDGHNFGGALIENLTDGSTARVGSQNLAAGNFYIETQTSLVGGATNTFQDGDQIRVTAIVGDRNTLLTPAVYRLGYDISSSENVNATALHNLAEYNHYPSKARVELSNDPVFTDAVEQKRVIQSVNSRSDTEIVIPNLFYGDLNQSAPVYAHIIKADGSVIDYGEVI